MKRQFKFNKKLLDALPPCPADAASREVEYSDTEVAGLRILVNRLGRKSWLLRYTYQGTKRAIKLGEYPGVDIAAARQAAIDARTQLVKGQDPQALREEVRLSRARTLQDFFEQHYLPHARTAKRSYADDVGRWTHHLRPTFGHLPLTELKTQDIQRFHEAKRIERCPATANRILALLKRALHLAVLWGQLDTSPVRGIRMHQENNQRHRYLAGEELSRFLAALDEEPNRTAAALFRFLLATGTRRNEALTARWDDIDLGQRQWRLPTSKNGRSRFVQLNDTAVKVLVGQMAVTNGEWVFPARGGRPGHLGDPKKAFARVLQRAGILDFRIHDLRHAYASMIVQSGLSLQVAQSLLGHRHQATTARYAHLAPAQLQEAAGRVAEVIEGAVRRTGIDARA